MRARNRRRAVQGLLRFLRTHRSAGSAGPPSKSSSRPGRSTAWPPASGRPCWTRCRGPWNRPARCRRTASTGRPVCSTPSNPVRRPPRKDSQDVGRMDHHANGSSSRRKPSTSTSPAIRWPSTRTLINRFATHTIGELGELPPETEVFLGGMLTQIRPMNTRRPATATRAMSAAGIEDLTGSVECVMWPDDYIQFKDLFEDDAIRFVKGTVERNRDEPGLQLTRVVTLEQGQRERTNGLVAAAEPAQARAGDLDQVARVLQRYPGSCPVFLLRPGCGREMAPAQGQRFLQGQPRQHRGQVRPGNHSLGPGRAEFSRPASMAMATETGGDGC